MMPFMWLGVVSADRRRFDAVTAPRLPMPVFLPAPDDGYDAPEKVGMIVELVHREGGAVLAVCEFDRPVDPLLVLSAATIGAVEARFVPDCPRAEAEYDEWARVAVLVLPVVTPTNALLLPRETFIWPEQLAAFEAEA